MRRTNLDRRAEVLGRHGVFTSVATADLEELVALSPEETVAPGEVLMTQGEPGDFACLILEGTVAIEVEAAVGTSVVASLGPGDLVGEIAAFSEMRRTATVRAVTPVTMLKIERASIRGLLSRSPDLAMSVIASLGSRSSQINGALVTLTQATRALAAGRFDPRMLDALDGMADQLSHFAGTFRDMAAEIREKKRHTHEMETAAAIQRAFLPQAVPSTPLADRFALASAMIPALDVGGDFYDYFMVSPTRLAVAVGDVSGKGVPAAIFMSVSRTMLKAVAREGGDAGAILTRVNALLAEDNAESMFVTIALALVDLDTGLVDYASGAHEETFLRTPSGLVTALGKTGPALGLFEGATVRSRSFALAPGDVLVLATDGVTEAFDPDRKVFGVDRLTAALAADAGSSAEAVVAQVTDAVAGFVRDAPPSDDITVLALLFRGDQRR